MNNLNLPQVAANQNQKEVTINDQAMALDAAFSEVLPVDLSGDDATLSQDDFTRNILFRCQGGVVARTLNVWPSKRLFMVMNEGSGALTVSAGNAGVTVPASNTAILHCDGVNIYAASSGSSAGIPDANDSSFYVRMNGAWVKLTAGDGVTFDTSIADELVLKASGSSAPVGPHVNDDGDWVRLVAGTNVSFDDSTPGELKVNASGGGGGSGLPDMTGNAGKFLAVNTNEDGTEWKTPGGGSNGETLRMSIVQSKLVAGYGVPDIVLDDDPTPGNTLLCLYLRPTSGGVLSTALGLIMPTTYSGATYYGSIVSRVVSSLQTKSIPHPFASSVAAGFVAAAIELDGPLTPYDVLFYSLFGKSAVNTTESFVAPSSVDDSLVLSLVASSGTANLTLTAEGDMTELDVAYDSVTTGNGPRAGILCSLDLDRGSAPLIVTSDLSTILAGVNIVLGPRWK